MQTARTGGPEQEIRWIEARIADLLSQLDQVRLDIEADVVRSPIDGRFLGGHGDTLAVVQDTTAWAAIMPVAWTDHLRLQPGLRVQLQWDAGLPPSTGQLTRLENRGVLRRRRATVRGRCGPAGQRGRCPRARTGGAVPYRRRLPNLARSPATHSGALTQTDDNVKTHNTDTGYLGWTLEETDTS